MGKFTFGKWTVRKLLSGFAVFAVNEDNREAVAYCLDDEANARLIAAVPELYELVMDELRGETGGILSFARRAKIKAVLERIDGKEEQE